MQLFKLMVTDRELISKELIGECWTYSISVLPKLQLKNVPVVLSELQFIGVNRNNMKQKKPDLFTLPSHVQSQNKNPGRAGLIIQKYK